MNPICLLIEISNKRCNFEVILPLFAFVRLNSALEFEQRLKQQAFTESNIYAKDLKVQWQSVCIRKIFFMVVERTLVILKAAAGQTRDEQRKREILFFLLTHIKE